MKKLKGVLGAIFAPALLYACIYAARHGLNYEGMELPTIVGAVLGLAFGVSLLDDNLAKSPILSAAFVGASLGIMTVGGCYLSSSLGLVHVDMGPILSWVPLVLGLALAGAASGLGFKLAAR